MKIKKSTTFVVQFNAKNEFDFNDETNFDLNSLNEVLNEIETKKISTIVDTKNDVLMNSIDVRNDHKFDDSKLIDDAQNIDFNEINDNNNVHLNFIRLKNVASFFKMSMQMNTYEKINKIFVDRSLLNRF